MQAMPDEFPYEKQLETIFGLEIMTAISLLQAPRQGIVIQDVEKFCFNARWDIVERTRKRMEASRTELHFIPYGTVTKRDAGILKTLSYKRPDVNNGESRLSGKHSVGFAGHVDSIDFRRSNKGVIFVYQTLYTSFVREVDEELKFWHKGLGQFVTFKDHPQFFEVVAHGFIYDTTDDVGKTHLGVYFDIEILDEMIEVQSGEDEIEELEWKDIDQLFETNDLYENWSKFIIASQGHLL